HRRRIILDFVQFQRKAHGKRRATQSDEAVDLLVTGDRHDARDDGDVDSDTPGPLDKVEVESVIEEELGDDEIQAGVDLLLEVSKILVGRGRLDVPLGVACSADAKRVILVTDQGDELGSVAKASLYRGKGFLADRRISSKREDVLDLRLEQSIDDLVELL